MKKGIVLFSILILTTALAVVFWPKTEKKEYSTQTARAGVVDVEARPKKLRKGDEMIFTLTLDKHSIDLSYDYLNIAVAVDDNGVMYKPVSWTGGREGHHVSGDLIFDKLNKKA